MNDKNGFTLVELLVVMVILGIITGLSIPLIRNIQESNEKRQYTTYMSSVEYSAKLYVDSYADDLFGHQQSGCAIVKYSDLKDKSLIKDIDMKDISCDSEETFVKVIKMDGKYVYATSIGCGAIKADGTVQVDVKIPEERTSDMTICHIDSATIMSFSATPDVSDSLSYKSRNVVVSVTSETGILNHIDIDYGFSPDNSNDPSIIGGWKKLSFSVMGANEQKQNILKGKEVVIQSDTITTDTYTGKLYLYIKVNKLEDLSGRSWLVNTGDGNIYQLGNYLVDNEKPRFNDSTVVSSTSEYNNIKPKLNLKVTDEIAGINHLKMCISYDSDTCSKTVKSIKDGNGYENYDASKVLNQIQSNYDGSSHMIYVTVADAAGNYQTMSYLYELAYQITYNSNTGSGTVNPTYCNKNAVCTLQSNSFTKTGYTFEGWYTGSNGGTKYGTTTKLTSNITVYARWWRYLYRFRTWNSCKTGSPSTCQSGYVYGRCSGYRCRGNHESDCGAANYTGPGTTCSACQYTCQYYSSCAYYANTCSGGWNAWSGWTDFSCNPIGNACERTTQYMPW